MSILISPIVTLDGAHVLSFSPEYAKLVKYFESDNFKATIDDRELSKEMLAELSGGLTTQLRTDADFDWSGKCVAVVSRARAVEIDEDTQKVVFDVGIISDHEIV